MKPAQEELLLLLLLRLLLVTAWSRGGFVVLRAGGRWKA